MGLRIIITGANGYIGSSLCKALKGKHNVFPLTRKDADLTRSISVNRIFRGDTYDAVIHCAAVGGSRLRQDDYGVMDENLIMYYNLFRNRHSFGRFINIGSGAEVHARHTPYGLSKWVIRNSCLQNGFYNIRVYGVFDENELDTRFIKSTILKAKKGDPPEINGNRLFDFIYMPDFVKIVEHYLEGMPRQEVDAVYEKKMTLSYIASFISDKEPMIKANYSPNYIGEYKDLGLEYIGLREGIKEVYERVNDSNGSLEYR